MNRASGKSGAMMGSRGDAHNRLFAGQEKAPEPAGGQHFGVLQREPLVWWGVALLTLIAVVIVPSWSTYTAALVVLAVLAARKPMYGLLLVIGAVAAVPHGLAANLFFRGASGPPLHPVDVVFLALLLAVTGRSLGGRFLAPRLGLREAPAPLASSASSGWLQRAFGDMLGVRIAFIGLMTAMAAAALHGVLLGNSLWAIGRDLKYLGFYALFPILMLIVDSQQRLRKAVRALLVGVIVYALLCVILALVPTSWSGLRAEVLTYWQGILRISFHNHLALLFVIPLFAYWQLAAPRVSVRIAAGAVSTLLLCAVALSLTRMLILASIVELGAVGVAFALRHRDESFWRKAFSLFTLVLVIGGAWIGADALARQDQKSTVAGRFGQLGARDSSFRGRRLSYEMALEDIAEQPWLGYGLGSMMRVPWAKEGKHGSERAGVQPAVDSLPLAALHKFGIIGSLGLLGWLWVSVLCAWRAWRAYVHDPVARVVAASGLLGVLGVGALATLQATLIGSRFVLFFVIVTALLERAASLAPVGPGAKKVAH